MTIKVAFEECLKDSPRFRSEIEAVQTDVGELETRLEKLLKQCQAMLEAGRVYYQTGKNFVSGLQSLGQHCSGDTVMEECLRTFSEKLSLILDAQGEVIETTQKSVKTKLQTFVKEDVRRFKDARKEFERSSESLEGALARNAQAPRGKSHEVEEASGALLNARRAFRSGALDYVLEINIIEAKKKTELLMAMLSLMDSQVQLFQNGHRSLSELDRYRQKLSEEHTQFVLNSAREKRDMEQRHAAIKQKDVSYDDSMMDFNPDAADGVAMEGYLNKRASNAFKTWSRRWFSIQKNQLVYQKKFKDQPTVVVEDLRLCTVKPNGENERRFCFEVVSPSKSCLLQADSERQQRAWISAVQSSIASAFQERRDVQHSPRQRCNSASAGGPVAAQENECLKALEEVQAVAGNRECCDCGAPSPDWASINLGITLCIVCSGIHRSLGVHFSKVRSLTLDSWEPELVKLMCELGNGVINGIYEARMDEITLKKPLASSPRGDKEAWIRSKYVEKKFIQKLPETARKPSQNRPGAKRNRAATQERDTQRPPLKPKPSRSTLPRSGNAEPEGNRGSCCQMAASSPVLSLLSDRPERGPKGQRGLPHRRERRGGGSERPSSRGAAVPLGGPAELPRHGRRVGPRRRRQLGQRGRGGLHAADPGRLGECPGGVRIPAAERRRRQPGRQKRKRAASSRHHTGSHGVTKPTSTSSETSRKWLPTTRRSSTVVAQTGNSNNNNHKSFMKCKTCYLLPNSVTTWIYLRIIKLKKFGKSHGFERNVESYVK
ncbi:arf-GAP with coiled-coil, ANK repeat and PH domain-containing protein 1 isoform X1 [Phycodurus eques]|uniref:arf-GAP with coiled-coil, ANK repeat and PH domain-containing protein 1 isoform X1 n=1 Tax=Phycodurus eques TaxID=693459 RepID=UPI002ACD9AA3|nr:arf-GAP with coiled-coil, ANK repeat and PH domain-containing protein 1 isoform X1 [Phycodurus eques]